MTATVHLGYEVGTGTPIAIPVQHLAVTGQTQLSGKTTTLEALVARSGLSAIAFVTKRGEGSFSSGHIMPPYFSERADWQFVAAVLEATLRERLKFERSWIMRACKGAKTLGEVQDNVQEALATAKGMSADVYLTLDHYLDIVVPQIERLPYSETVTLKRGLNVMDLAEYSTELQALVIRSVLEWVYKKARGTLVIIPEAWEFIPQNRGSPVLLAAEELIRKGGNLKNFVWLDSQDIAGVHKNILRQVGVWILGVQREANEVKRALAHIPGNVRKPKLDDVMELERGQFFACFGKTVAKVYVQPAWLEGGLAKNVAQGNMRAAALVDTIAPPIRELPAPIEPEKEDEVDKTTADALTAENERLKTDVAVAEARGYEKGLRRAGEFWNAAALDVRDKINEAAGIADHLAQMARDGRWALPTSAKNPKPSAPAVARRDGTSDLPSINRAENGSEGSGEGCISAAARAMLAALVRSHPQPLRAELWGVAVGKSPESAKAGPWYRNRNTLVAAGFIEEAGNGFRATPAGIAESGQAPAKPKDEVALWALWRNEIAAIVEKGMPMLRVLAAHRRHRLTNEQWALLSGKSRESGKAGPWYGAIKLLREWELIEGEGLFSITAKGCAVIEDLPEPRSDTAEAIRLARRALLKTSQRHYDVLTHPMTRAELATKLGVGEKSAKAGPWYGAIKELVESGLVVDDGGTLRREEERLADHMNVGRAKAA